MKITLLHAILVSTVFANPTPKTTWRDDTQGLEIRGLGDQGDGFYSAKFNTEGVATVEFTPWAELNLTKPETSPTVSIVEAETNITKRAPDGITCTGEWANWQELDTANIALANNAGACRGDYDCHVYNPNHWGWVHHAGVTAYFCPYFGRTWIDWNAVISFTSLVSNHCGGSSALGWRRGYTWKEHAWYEQGDISVGRTYRGRSFCTGNFYG